MASMLARKSLSAATRTAAPRRTARVTRKVAQPRQVAARCTARRPLARRVSSIHRQPARTFFRGREPAEEKVDINKLDPHQREAHQALKEGRTANAHGLHADAGLLGDSGLWKKYGFATTLGFGAVAAVSKEFLILNEETAIMGVFSAFAFTVYITMGQKVLDYIEGEQNENVKFWREYYDAQIKAYQEWRDEISGLSRDPEHWEALNQYQLDVAEKYYDTLNRVAQMEGVKITEQALQLTEQKEAQEGAKFAESLITKTMEAVDSHFSKLSKEEKNSMFEESLAMAEAVAKGQSAPESKGISPEAVCNEQHLNVIADLWAQHGTEVKVSKERQNQLFEERRALLSKVFPKPPTWEETVKATGWTAEEEALFKDEAAWDNFRMEKWNEMQNMVKLEDCGKERFEIPESYLNRLAEARGQPREKFWDAVTNYNKKRGKK